MLQHSTLKDASSFNYPQGAIKKGIQMRKASFSVEKPTSHTIAHNTREDAPKYLIGLAEGRENLYEEYYSFENFQELAEARYLEANKQKMQTSQKEALFEEALISLEKHHTKDDVIKLFEALNKKYTGHTLINLAIHNDEGHFVRDGIEYYPTKHILQKEDGWYILDENDTHILEALKDKDFKPKTEDFKVKVKIKDFEKVYNYHAHVVFSRFDLETGKSARFQKSTMSERYKFVAEQMSMKYAPDENRLVKKSIGQHKADLSATRNAKLVMKKELEQVHLEEKTILKKENTSLKSQNIKNKNAKEKLKEGNKALEMQLKELNTQLQLQLSNREQHAQREALVRKLKEELKAKTLTVDSMQTKFAQLEEKLLKEKSHLEAIIAVREIDIQELQTQNKALQDKKTILGDKVIELEKKIISRVNIVPQKEISEELQKIITEEFIKKEILESRMGKSTPTIIVKDSDSFLKRIQKLTSQGVQSVANTLDSLKKEITEWKEKYNNLIEVLKSKDQKIADLKEKVRELSTKQQIQAHNNPLEGFIEQYEALKGEKSDSSNLGKIKRDR